jgi:hypothetical protein
MPGGTRGLSRLLRRGRDFRRGHTLRRGGARLVAETEAFLSGRYLDALLLDDGGIAAWVWINRLAHADAVDIIEERRVSAPLGSWAWAVDALTETTVTLAAGDPTVVRHLQRSCLVPLELTMMGPEFTTVLPAEVVALGVRQLQARAHTDGGGSGPTHPTG